MKKLLLVALLFCSIRSFGAIALVQSKMGGTGSGTTSATTTAVGYTSNTTAGNLLVLTATARCNSGSSSAPTAFTVTTSGFTWTNTRTATYTDATNIFGGRVSQYYIANAASMSSATTTTVSTTRSLCTSLNVAFTIYEFSGVATTTPLDTGQLSSGGGAGNPPKTPNLVTTATDLIIETYTAESGSNLTAGASFTLGVNYTPIPVPSQSQYILNQTSGTITDSFGGNATNIWCAVADAFKSASQVHPHASVNPFFD